MMTGESPLDRTDRRVKGVQCPVLVKGKPCGERFPCAKKGDLGSYDLAKWEKHLRDDHGIIPPKPIPYFGF